MQEHVVASDDASVTVDQTREELENHLPLEPTEEPGGEVSLEEAMFQLAQQVVRALQQVHETGDTFAALAVHPSILDGFTAAFRSLPDELLPANVRDQLPIIAEERVNPLKVITGTDLEIQFLYTRYGPRDQGGTGLIPDLQAAVQRESSPVRISHDFLKMYYLMDLAEKTSPKLFTPTGSDVLRTLAPNLGRR